jgi:hypothetical protein
MEVHEHSMHAGSTAFKQMLPSKQKITKALALSDLMKRAARVHLEA